jgi:hypothetical protein
MKRNKVLRIAAILLAIVMVTSVAISGTLARYTAQATANGLLARVAAFRVLVNDVIISGNGDPVPVSLWNSTTAGALNIWEADLTTAETSFRPVNATSFGDLLIFPGMGVFGSLKVENLSEVPVALSIALANGAENVITTGLPMEFNLGVIGPEANQYANLAAMVADTTNWNALTATSLSAGLAAENGTIAAIDGVVEVIFGIRWGFLNNTAPGGAPADRDPALPAESRDKFVAGTDAIDTQFGVAAANWVYQTTREGTNAPANGTTSTAYTLAQVNSGANAFEITGSAPTTAPGFNLGNLVINVLQVD